MPFVFSSNAANTAATTLGLPEKYYTNITVATPAIEMSSVALLFSTVTASLLAFVINTVIIISDLMGRTLLHVRLLIVFFVSSRYSFFVSVAYCFLQCAMSNTFSLFFSSSSSPFFRSLSPSLSFFFLFLFFVFVFVLFLPLIFFFYSFPLSYLASQRILFKLDLFKVSMSGYTSGKSRRTRKRFYG